MGFTHLICIQVDYITTTITATTEELRVEHQSKIFIGGAF